MVWRTEYSIDNTDTVIDVDLPNVTGIVIQLKDPIMREPNYGSNGFAIFGISELQVFTQ